METALGNLGINESQTYGFENCDVMRTNATFEHYIASVCFHNEHGDESKNGLPQMLYFSIILPSEVRNYEHSWLGKTWKQSNPTIGTHVSRSVAEIGDDGSMEYLQEGFVPLQYYISTEYVRMASKGAKMPTPRLRPMNSDKLINNDAFSESSVTTAKIIMVLGFMFPVVILVKLIVEEHELGQCFVLEVNNAGKCLQVTAWFCNASIQLLITSFCLGVLIMYTSTSIPMSELFYTVPFFASYSISVASFIIFLSAIIRSTNLALVLVPIIWFLLPFPFLFTEQLKFESSFLLYLLATFLMCNVTLSRGLSLLFEDHTSTKFARKKLLTDDNFINLTFPALIGIFFLQAVIYSLLVPIIQVPEWVLFWRFLKSIPRKCRLCCRRKKRRHFKENFLNLNTMFQEESRGIMKDIKSAITIDLGLTSTKNATNKPVKARVLENVIREAGIEFRRVSKKFLKTYVIQKFTLSVFPGEVVVLLGHNSSGKTTIMRMIRGVILPSFGEIYISGINTVTNNLYFNKRSQKHVGISLTYIALFVELTVSDLLVFFSRLRGLRKFEAREEVESYLQSLKMEYMKNILVGNLSIGQKRIVQSICAFVGRTEIVVLHKPLDGVDGATATLFFSFVQREKKNRSIFVTTNRSKVASFLGDRIGILVQGRLLFLGTERELGDEYNDVYRLTIYGNANCDFDEIQMFLEDFTTTGVEMESRMADLAVYLINRVDFPGLIKLLDNLPRKKVELKIDSFKIQECSLDQILINWFTPEPFEFALQEMEPEHLKLRSKYDSLKRFLRLVSQFLIVFRHRALIDVYNSHFLIIKIILPMFMTLWLGICIAHHPSNVLSQGNKVFPLANREDSGITLAQIGSPLGTNGPLKAAYDEFITTGAKEVDADLDITDMEQMRQSYGILEDEKILGTVLFKADEVEALYNNRWGYAAPHSLGLVMNSLAVGFVGPDSGIKAEMETLPFSTTHRYNNLHNVPLLTISVVCFSFCFCWTMPLLYMNLSQKVRFNYIELIAGMRLSLLASAILLYELLVFAFAFVTLHLVIIILGMDSVMYGDFCLIYTHVVMLVALCVLSTNILISLGSTVTQNAYLLVLTFHTVGVIGYLLVRQFSKTSIRYIYIFMDFYPLFSMMDHLMTVANVSETKWLCRDIQIYETSVYVDKCTTKPNCCHDPKDEYYHHRYVACNYIYLVIILILISFRIKSSLPKIKSRHGNYLWDSDADSYKDQKILHFGQPSDLENTWIKEKSRVRTLERSLIWSRSLHVGHLSVLFDKFVALDKINFMLDRYQVLSLYGPNGSGKTVLTKSILGFYAPNTGRVDSPNRMPYQRYKSQIGNLAGYSAQEVFLMQELTILEVLRLVLHIRHWLKDKQLKYEATTICKILNLYDYRHNILSTCSQGVLKRLSIALALMTNTDLILLDDPFANLDVITLHTVLHSIQDACRHGLCIIYTCSDADFSAPAQRLAAISRSALIGIGERHELTQNYYSTYYIVETKINMPNIDALIRMELEEDENDVESASERRQTQIFLGVSTFVMRIFPKAILNPSSVSYPRIGFWLSSQIYSVSQIFQKLHRYQDNFYSFTIAQPSVSTLFHQNSPEEERPRN
ncbi:ATP-binding cassette sub-family A member 5 isoform X2 [Drosophila serrata]|nr:ATP-binding cassette sub-family A member 5 isoform X2 [Drosophila serrata]